MGKLISSADDASELAKDRFSTEQADLLADADFDTDSIIILQQFTGGSPLPFELNSVGVIAEESAFFVNVTTQGPTGVSLYSLKRASNTISYLWDGVLLFGGTTAYSNAGQNGTYVPE